MDLGSVFLILALLLLVGLFIARPLFDQKSISFSQEEHVISGLMAERDRIINALHELDFDFALQKIPEEDYPLQRAQLMQRGADVLRELDSLHADEKPTSVEDRLEEAIELRRADMARRQLSTARTAVPGVRSPSGVGGDDDLEAMIANRRRVRQDKAAGFCPQCGNPVQKMDRFCPKCGTSL